MTSNLGAAFLNELPDDGGPIPKETRELVNGAIRAHLPPEFINRLDSIVIYNRLSRQDVRNIVEVRLREIQKRLRSNGRNITLEPTTEVLDFLAAAGEYMKPRRPSTSAA